jgi:hypothetical protein
VLRRTAILVLEVSDVEDCSIGDRGLFDTPEWRGETLNTACNYPESNETNFLFDAEYFYDQLISLKWGREDAVIFAAVVGVPMGDDSPCQGTGEKLSACLADPAMQYVPQTFFTEEGQRYHHFIPGCTSI